MLLCIERSVWSGTKEQLGLETAVLSDGLKGLEGSRRYRVMHDHGLRPALTFTQYLKSFRDGHVRSTVARCPSRQLRPHAWRGASVER